MRPASAAVVSAPRVGAVVPERLPNSEHHLAGARPGEPMRSLDWTCDLASGYGLFRELESLGDRGNR